MSEILQSQTGAVLTVTINRPEKKNAITNAMYGTLVDALERAQADKAIRCVLVTGAGDTFTAGNDLMDFAAVAAGGLAREQIQGFRFLDRLAEFEKPLIAAVPGLAVGIGTTLLLHCDLVVLSETAVLSVPFVDLALVPEAGSSLLLQQRIGYVRAFAMFALGERIDAKTALSWGLANKVVPPDVLQGEAMAAAQALASKPPGALAASKRLMRDSEALKTVIAMEADIFEARLKSPEAREAFTAFAQRRPPDYGKF
ncbi:MAG: enoyl-CoA hydratase [Beijerinckiaceae bacterium]|nr:enoyl-CoA hydratase [Beijerinckiaceae bacterium]